MPKSLSTHPHILTHHFVTFQQISYTEIENVVFLSYKSQSTTQPTTWGGSNGSAVVKYYHSNELCNPTQDDFGGCVVAVAKAAYSFDFPAIIDTCPKSSYRNNSDRSRKIDLCRNCAWERGTFTSESP
mmetsp:Transcript_51804/g.76783  ORF Transcript_51804/g.76783 Transcript_51804/m.76783 type:complete len:128 (-) Transcript_51804:1042-1425(-)